MGFLRTYLHELKRKRQPFSPRGGQIDLSTYVQILKSRSLPNVDRSASLLPLDLDRASSPCASLLLPSDQFLSCPAPNALAITFQLIAATHLWVGSHQSGDMKRVQIISVATSIKPRIRVPRLLHTLKQVLLSRTLFWL